MIVYQAPAYEVGYMLGDFQKVQEETQLIIPAAMYTATYRRYPIEAWRQTRFRLFFEAGIPRPPQ